MSKDNIAIAVIMILMLTCNILMYASLNKYYNESRQLKVEIAELMNPRLPDTMYYAVAAVNTTATVYHPVPIQTDDTPFETADGSFIDTSDWESMKWVALSKDLLKKFKYGDTLYLVSSVYKVAGPWAVHDRMNDRYENRVDLLQKDGVNMYKEVMLLKDIKFK